MWVPTVTVRYHLHEGQVSDDRRAMLGRPPRDHRRVRRSRVVHPSVLARSEAILRWDELRDDLRRATAPPPAAPPWRSPATPAACPPSPGCCATAR